MAEQILPLQAIKQSELELRQRVDEARHQADARLQAARAGAQRMILLADQEGRQAADARYQAEIERTRREAEAIIAAARAEAATLQQQGTARLDVVAKRIVELVLPGHTVPG